MGKAVIGVDPTLLNEDDTVHNVRRISVLVHKPIVDLPG